MKKRIVWIDFIKIIACLLVVVLHSITIGLSEHTYTNGLWIYYLGVFAIPLFFMTNGYLQLGKVNQYRYVFQKVSYYDYRSVLGRSFIFGEMGDW